MNKSILKIGILTFHRCINYGSYWQARCLADEIMAKGHDVSILDHRSGKVDIAEWKCALQPVLPTPVPTGDRRLYRKKIERFFSAFESLPLSPSFSLDDPSGMEKYDVVIVGSDEVWNFTHPWYGNYPLFYGTGIKAERMIAYAASFGNYDSLSDKLRELPGRLDRFESISVRDENSRNIIRNAVGIDPPVVLDPCLLNPVRTEKPDIFIATRPFAAVYGHNFSPSIIELARRWSEKRKLPLVSIGYRNDWADEQWLTAGPLEFASFMRQSEAVITNFFHGCVFSFLYARPFICETTHYRNIKIADLVRRTGAERHLVTGETKLNFIGSLLEQPLDEEIVNNLIKLRKVSGDFLDNSLKQHTVDDPNAKVLQSEEYS